MADCPRVVLLLYPYAEYDRGVLQGIARYARIHGPWVFHFAGEETDLPLPAEEAINAVPIRSIHAHKARCQVRSSDVRRWNADGFIGRLQTREVVEAVREAGVPVIAMDLSGEQLADGRLAARVSEIRPDSHKAGQIAAEHLLDRGFRNFGYCGYAGRIWSQRRQRGFCQRLEKAGYACHVYQPAKRSQKRSLLWQQECGAVVTWLRIAQACGDHGVQRRARPATYSRPVHWRTFLCRTKWQSSAPMTINCCVTSRTRRCRALPSTPGKAATEPQSCSTA